MKPLYLTLPEATELLRCSASRVYKMTMSKSIPFYKVGGKLYFKEAELIDFIEGKSMLNIKKEDFDDFDLLSPFQSAA
jgi:excisionase family DNA binding protein